MSHRSGSESQPFLRKRRVGAFAQVKGEYQLAPATAEDFENDNVLHVLRRKEPTFEIPCIVWVLVLCLIIGGGGIILTFIKCNKLSQTNCQDYCPRSAPKDVIFQPIPQARIKLRSDMKISHDIRRANAKAEERGDFNNTRNFKKVLSKKYEDKTFVNETMHKKREHLNIDISAVVYSDKFNSHIGEVGVTINSLHLHESVDQIVVVEDSVLDDALLLWDEELDMQRIRTATSKSYAHLSRDNKQVYRNEMKSNE
ncbi:hypothetical protein RFI_17167 [Reticulomyxa filosa]|uniref:Uncharacterized protein n=1 Tax=Reticulomyxa filosa TaxID=46433 RepID=X6N2T4_RETFI|nr:hypothetical protein RFI_17167 [Reticulomyxa filosa]|eukprot:ETO20049.1 hypothetical protein RFI_17167 [Reticulomyxa filosa]